MTLFLVLLTGFCVIQLTSASFPPTKNRDEIESLNTGTLKNQFNIEAPPCGSNAVRIIKYLTLNTTTTYCTCRRGGYFGDPNLGCTPECESGAQCGGGKVCSKKECIDACPSFCGENMKCEIQNYRPTCTCIAGYHNVPGNPCIPMNQPLTGYATYDPCEPNPCGRFAFCSRKTYNTFECSCKHEDGRSPPNCRAGCNVDSDCPVGRVCERHHYCEASNGREQLVSSPCDSDRCGPFTEKVVVDGRRVCKCLPGYYGIAPNCTPECTKDSDCPLKMSCYHKTNQCVDPCIGACSMRAICTVQNHTPVCVCTSDSALTDSNPFKSCYFLPSLPSPYPTETKIPNYCEDVTGRCGPNAKCNQEGNFFNCTCVEGYFGSPPNCRRECGQNSDCPGTKTCINFSCINYCDIENTCGINADCNVVNHTVRCSCPAGSTGDPYQSCTYNDVCTPNNCHGNGACEVGNGKPCCTCNPNNTPCKPECTVNAECPLTSACVNYSCIDPCPGLCGENAICRMSNHVPICLCQDGFTGDPFAVCAKQCTTEHGSGNP